MNTKPTLSSALNHFKHQGFSTFFELNEQGIWDMDKKCFYPYFDAKIVACIGVEESVNIRIFSLLIADKIKGIYIKCSNEAK